MSKTGGFIVESVTRSARGGLPHFLLIYRDQRCVSTIIVEARSLAAARMKVAAVGLDTPNSFRLGHELEAELIPLVLPEQIVAFSLRAKPKSS
jgi:hypothetical protein